MQSNTRPAACAAATQQTLRCIIVPGVMQQLLTAVICLQVLGSLELLGNPTGLLAALSQGIQDLMLLPLEAQSPVQVSSPHHALSQPACHALGLVAYRTLQSLPLQPPGC